MREVEFRAWYRDKKLMEDWDLVKYSFPDILENDDIVIMQYTGLKDCDGTKIFEGDILKMPSFNPNLNIVRFDRGGFCLEPITGIESYFWSDIKYAEDDGSEVIGNIYENPELLGENKTN